MISRRSSAIGWRLAMMTIGPVVDLALGLVEHRVVGDHLARESVIRVDQRDDRLVDHALGMAAHRGDAVGAGISVPRHRRGGCAACSSASADSRLSGATSMSQTGVRLLNDD